MWQRKRTIVAILTCTLLLVGTGICQAQSSDWLSGLFAPLTTSYYRAPSACNTCSVPTTAYYRSPAACSTCPTPVRQVVRYVPQTCYRSTWARVPVTSYRPVATTDPMTGCPVTCMKPCTTFTWQARRVPYTTYRPVSYGVACNPCATAAPACGPCGTPGFGSTYYSGGTGSGCSSCGVPAPPSPASPAAPSTGSPVPADVPPALDSSKIPLNNGASSAANGSEYQQRKPETPAPPANPPADQTQPNANGGGVQPPANTPKTSTLRPVPDPEALRGPSMPALLNPRDRTATLTHRPNVASPLRWAGSLPTRTAVYQAPVAAPAEEVWDAGGWEAVGQ